VGRPELLVVDDGKAREPELTRNEVEAEPGALGRVGVTLGEPAHRHGPAGGIKRVQRKMRPAGTFVDVSPPEQFLLEFSCDGCTDGHLIRGVHEVLMERPRDNGQAPWDVQNAARPLLEHKQEIGRVPPRGRPRDREQAAQPPRA